MHTFTRKAGFPAQTTLVALLLGMLTPTASAHGWHSGFAPGFVQGFSHPFSGLDHLLAMFAVGLWSSHAGRRFWLVPASFVALLLVGAQLAAEGIALPAIEPTIAASLLVLGLLLALQARLPAAAVATLVGGFALFHGAAHGIELGPTAAPGLTGVLCATLLLHLAGIVAGRFLKPGAVWLRLAGTGIAVCGAGLSSGLI
ncbi:MAG: HupE/UreJ family protein [Rhodocyclaceae bacterium]|nr:HupE/UreJ family protein [Rhodocyclaceae bacterium]